MSRYCYYLNVVYKDPIFPSIGRRVVVLDHLEKAYDCDFNNNDNQAMEMEFIRLAGVLRISLEFPT